MSTVRVRLLVVFAALALVATAFAQPSARGYVDMAYVPQVEQVFLFGGQQDYFAPYAPLGETWWYDPAGDVWTQVATDPEPGARGASSIEVHTPSGTVVMFGGGVPIENGFQPLTETWLFDPTEGQWRMLSFEEGETPEAVIGEMFAYHEAADLFVLHGGFTLDGQRFLNDTWHFDLDAKTWTRADPANVPPGMNYKAFAYDPRTERIVMSGGRDDDAEAVDETWSYDPREPDWIFHERSEEAAAVGYARMVYDADAETLVRFGGVSIGDEEAAGVWTMSEDFTWSQAATEGEGPGQLSRHAMTFVPGVGSLVFGGVVRGRPDFNADLWVLDLVEGAWQLR